MSEYKHLKCGLIILCALQTRYSQHPHCKCGWTGGRILYPSQNVLTKHPHLISLPFHAYLIRFWNAWHLRLKDLTLGSTTLDPPVCKCQEFRTGVSSVLSVSVKSFGKNWVFLHFSPISQFSGVWCKYLTIRHGILLFGCRSQLSKCVLFW